MTKENKRSAQRESCRSGTRRRGPKTSSALSRTPSPSGRLSRAFFPHPLRPSAQTYQRSQRAIFAKVPGSYEMAVPMASFDSLRRILLFRLLQFPRSCAAHSIITHAEMRISAPRKGRPRNDGFGGAIPSMRFLTPEAAIRINVTRTYCLSPFQISRLGNYVLLPCY